MFVPPDTNFGQSRSKFVGQNRFAKVGHSLCFIGPEDVEFQETMNNAQTKLELPMKSLQRREACGQEPDPRRSGNACIVEVHESTRKRLGENPARRSRRSLCQEGVQHIESLQSCAQVFSMPQIPDAMAAVDKDLEKLEKLPVWQMTKVRSSKEVIKKGTNCHLNCAELEPQFQKKKQRASCAQR